MFPQAMTIAGFDPELAGALDAERQRQEDHIELIASENYASPRVLEAQGSVLTNKYAEGYPGKRYYGGCEFVDVAEQLAIERAKKLFGADLRERAAAFGLAGQRRGVSRAVNPGDTILGMSLDHGGHLTHGAKVNFSGKLFNAVQYGLDPDTGEIDYDAGRAARAASIGRSMIIAGFSAYSRVSTCSASARSPMRVGAYFFVDMAHVAGPGRGGPLSEPGAARRRRHDHHAQDAARSARRPDPGARQRRDHKKLNSLVFPGTQGGPLMHVIAAKAVAFLEALQPEFTDYQKQVLANARAMAARLQKRGYKIVSGGTDNHLFLLDLIDKNITGKDADAALGRAHITVNKNAVPNDPRPPMVTSGLRIGTPAVTTRGFKEARVRAVARLDRRRARRPTAARRPSTRRARAVIELCRRFPVYGP